MHKAGKGHGRNGIIPNADGSDTEDWVCISFTIIMVSPETSERDITIDLGCLAYRTRGWSEERCKYSVMQGP